MTEGSRTRARRTAWSLAALIALAALTGWHAFAVADGGSGSHVLPIVSVHQDHGPEEPAPVEPAAHAHSLFGCLLALTGLGLWAALRGPGTLPRQRRAQTPIRERCREWLSVRASTAPSYLVLRVLRC